MTRHRWGDKARLEHKSEQQCIHCGLVKVTRHESEGGRNIYWTEYWRGLDLLRTESTPACEPAGADAIA